jgi:putative transposase
LADNQVYHILNRGNGRQDVFHKPEDFAVFIKLIAEAKARYPVQLLAHCLMTNHFHLVVKTRAGGDLSKWMQWLMTSHVRRYHRHYGGSGHVWQGRFKSFPVQENDHLLTVVRYVEGNPVRAGMVTSAMDWLWSSHRENTGTGSANKAVPVPLDEEANDNSGTGKVFADGAGQAPVEPVAVVDVGEMGFPLDWTAYVDRAWTNLELSKLHQSSERQ